MDGEQDTEESCDALAALEAEPDREDMADEGADAGGERRDRSEPGGEQHGDRALQSVEEEGRGRELPVAGAQDVGRADIAGADGADVTEAGAARQHQAEGDRTQQIAEGEGADEHERGRFEHGVVTADQPSR